MGMMDPGGGGGGGGGDDRFKTSTLMKADPELVTKLSMTG